MSASTVEVTVVEGGLLTTIQDVRGRPGLGRYGVPPGGAIDAEAARLAGRLVGNEADAPVLEITLQGPTLVFTAAAHVGLAGADLGAQADHQRLRPDASYRLSAGATLRFTGPPSGAKGARAYLAVEGGFVVPSVLGSASTDRRSGFGGGVGRELRAGDALSVAGTASGALRALVRAHPGPPVDPGIPVEIRVVATPIDLGWAGRGGLRELVAPTWNVSPASDRNGLRLTGGRIADVTGRVASVGVPVGAVQVPPSGEPIVTLADGPVTGGYPIVGVVPRLDHGRLAQLAPGATVRFRPITVEAARALAVAVADAATRDRIELDPGDVGAGWAG